MLTTESFRRIYLRSTFRRNQPRSHSESHQAWNIMQIQPGHQFHAVIFDGLGADFQDAADLLGVLPLGDELKDFALPDGQLLKRDFPSRGFWHGNVFQRTGRYSRTRNRLLINQSLHDCLGLFGPAFRLFRASLRQIRPRFRLFGARFCHLCPGFGLFCACFRLLGAGLCLFNPRQTPLLH